MKNFKTGLITLLCLLFGIDASAFKVDGIEYEFTEYGNSVKVVQNGYDGYSGHIVIPSEVTFNNRTYDVTEIAEEAFSWNYGVESITLPFTITEIGKESFSGCINMTSINIPYLIAEIDEGAFSFCESLISIKIPYFVTSIGKMAFQGCRTLTSIEIPNSVTSIGEYAFSACDSLTSIKVDAENKVYDSRENCNAIIETASNTLISGCHKTVIPNSVTSIGSTAFDYCKYLTSIEIPNSVTSIGFRAFSNCENLTSMVIPNSVTSIGDWVFSGCLSLTSLEIPNSVTSIGENIIYYCNSLTSITIQNLNPVMDGQAIQAPIGTMLTYYCDVSNPEVLTVDDGGYLNIHTPGITELTITGTDWNDEIQTRVCKVIVGGARANISKAGYATFSTLSDYQVPEELQAGIVEVSGKRANFTLLEPTTSCYPSEEAVILKGAPGEYFLPTPMEKTVLEKNADNDLKPAHTNSQINAEAGNELFVLANGNNGLGFYYQMGCPDGSYVKNLYGKGYLDLSSTTLMGLNSLRLFDISVTGIDEVETENGSNASVVYSLSGVRMNQPVDQLPKGVYIVNGKKVMVK